MGAAQIISNKNLTCSSLAKASRVITVSDNSKKDIMKIFGTQEEKIKVISCGIDRIFHAVKDSERAALIKSKFDIHGEFIFFAAQLHRRKNVIRLLIAYDKLKKEKK